MNAHPVMTSMSDVVALKRVDMERIGRQRMKYLVPIRPRLVAWNVNNERTSVYFPNINRSFISDQTYIPGQIFKKRCHENSVNRMASWTPYSPLKQEPLAESAEPLDEQEDDEDAIERRPSLTDPLQHPTLIIKKPLRLLSREYKHPLSMYEETLNNMYSRYAATTYPALIKDPTLPRQYYPQPPQFIERPESAGRPWVTNRWRLWSGGSPTSPA